MIVQVDLKSGQPISSHKYFSCAHQTRDRIYTPNKKNIAIFDNLDLRKNFVEIDGQRYPRDSLFPIYEENVFSEQYKILKLYHREYLGEQLLTTFVSYPDMKAKYPVQIIDLRHQTDHITPKKFNYFKNMVIILTVLDCFY